ncbi:hypothetical protein [Halobellus inordinatus]|uniref:hypothetical protein n=1 Tax=Halobellus inordinatus TaxID=1126236 RepID=UPI00210BD51B|nr:hypothetical protein [Halobellus inordinatus]
MSAELATDNGVKTRRRREERCEGVIEMPFNEQVEVECPACGDEFLCTIATPDPEKFSPSFGSCTAWECDALIKFRSDGTEDDDTSDEPIQSGLAAFGGGAR